MYTRGHIGWLMAVVMVSGSAGGPWAAQAAGAEPAGARRAADCLPEGLVAAVVLRDGDQQVAAIRKIVEGPAVAESPGYKALAANPDLLKGRIFAAGLAAAAGTDLWSAGGAILGRELAVGLALDEKNAKQPRFIAVAVARDPALLERILKQVHAVTGLEVDGKPDDQRTKQFGGLTVFSSNPQEHHCFFDGVLMVSNDGGLLKSAIDAARSGQGRLSGSPSYREAVAEVPAKAVAFAFGDMARLRSAIGKGKPLPAQVPNALNGLLYGAWWHTLINAEKAVVWITAEGKTFALDGKVVSGVALPETHRGFTPKPTLRDTWSAEKLPGFLAETSVTRGWAELFAEREALLTLPAAGDLVNFSNVLTALMGQVDFVNDLLPNVEGPVRLVVTRQDFGRMPYTPTPKLPAFGLVIPFKSVEAMNLSRRLQTASQMAVAFLNYDAAQKNKPGYLIETQQRGPYTLVTTTFADGPRMAGPAPGGDKDARPATRPAVQDVRYNFAPAAAVVGNRYIFTTSAELLRNLVDVVSEASAPTDGRPAPPADVLTINGTALAAVLADNRAELIANNMLEKDHSRSQAEGEVDGLLGLLKFAERLDLTSSTGEKQARLSLKLTFRGF
ncbi:MAG: DUF3352 domain-containing protein [Phycisphaerae bacterium]|jgi:hypothetical protein